MKLLVEYDIHYMATTITVTFVHSVEELLHHTVAYLLFYFANNSPNIIGVNFVFDVGHQEV